LPIVHLIHDLRIVLTAVATCLDAMRNTSDAPTPPHELRVAEQLLGIGLAIIDELVVSSERRSPMTHVEVNRLLDELDDVVRLMVGPQVTVRKALTATESRVYARRVDLERIVLNLVLNAAAAMPEGGVLTIDTTASAPHPTEEWTDPAAPFGEFRLTIGDTGRGMSGRELECVNNPFARARPDGTGLGLACVSLILTRLDGAIEIDSRPGAGTVAAVLLPLAPPGGNQVH
jgi:two-component system cell cycle sensor histidine kinase/response regulator CckA